MSQKSPGLVNVFIAYSRKDTDYLNQLRTYLQPLHRNETIKIWYDGEISPGSSWEQEIKTHLHDADIILLLVSADSLASDYFYEREMAEAMQRHQHGQTIVIPVILKDCAWELTALHQLQALPQDGKPISSWASESSAYANIVRGLYRSIDIAKERKARATQLPLESQADIVTEQDKTPTTSTPSSPGIEQVGISKTADPAGRKSEAQTNLKQWVFRYGLPVLGVVLLFFIVKQFFPGNGNGNGNEPSDSIVTGDTLFDPEYITLGWHPLWENNMAQRYDHDNFTHISYYYSYDVNPTNGNYNRPNSIRRLDSLMSREERNPEKQKSLLTITNIGLDNNRTFFSDNKWRRNTLIDSSLAIVKRLNLNGIHLDFDSIPAEKNRSFTFFVAEFSRQLKAINDDHIFSLNLPRSHNREGVFDNINSLKDHVDFFIIPGYNYFDNKATANSPVSPLKAVDNKFSLTSSVDFWLTSGLEPSRFLLSLPYFGYVWTCKNNSIEDEDCSFKRSITYWEVIEAYQESDTPLYDSLSQSAYFTTKSDGDTYEKVWFEDAKTLKTKYDWIKQKGLGGIAIFALGYDGDKQELNQVLKESFH